MDVAVAEQDAFEVAVLVEAEQRVMTRTFEETVVGRGFLIPVRGADGAIHVAGTLWNPYILRHRADGCQPLMTRSVSVRTEKTPLRLLREWSPP